jgi:hypothetical protein
VSAFLVNAGWVASGAGLVALGVLNFTWLWRCYLRFYDGMNRRAESDRTSTRVIANLLGGLGSRSTLHGFNRAMVVVYQRWMLSILCWAGAGALFYQSFR